MDVRFSKIYELRIDGNCTNVVFDNLANLGFMRILDERMWINECSNSTSHLECLDIDDLDYYIEDIEDIESEELSNGYKIIALVVCQTFPAGGSRGDYWTFDFLIGTEESGN